MSDQVKDPLNDELEEELRLVHNLEALVESPGWLILRSIMSSQERIRRNEILTGNHAGMDGLINRDKLISELAGINTVMNMPASIILDSKTKISGLLEEQNLETETPISAEENFHI